MVTIKRRTSKGRRKIEIKKIAKEDALQVTFSKRKAGLFKKADEICTLCGAETAIVVFSPAGKLCFSYGNPSVDDIIDDYLVGNHRPPVTEADARRRRSGHVREFEKQHADLVNKLDVEKKKGEEYEKLRIEGRNRFWWETPIEELGLSELKQLKVAMEELRKHVMDRSNEIIINSAPLTSFLTPAANPIGMTSTNRHGYSAFGQPRLNPNHQFTAVGMTNTNHHQGYSSVGMTNTSHCPGYSVSGPAWPDLNHQSNSAIVSHHGHSEPEPNPNPNQFGTFVVPNNHGYDFGSFGDNGGGGFGDY